MTKRKVAPGRPGQRARWISSRKSGVGTAMNGESPVWFTVGEGIVNEVFYPRIDCADTRQIGFLVAGPAGFFADERCDTEQRVATTAEGVPAYVLTNTCRRGYFRITKTIFTDVRRPTLLIRIKFEVLEGGVGPWRLFLVASPHVVNQGGDNNAWLGSFRGVELLYAQRQHVAMAIGCSTGWHARTCSYVGANDARHMIEQRGCLEAEYASAPHGDVDVVGEVSLSAQGESLLAIGFGEHPDAAGHVVRAALLADPDETLREYEAGWHSFQRSFAPLAAPRVGEWDLYRTSLTALRTHESKRFHGGVIASLAIPWGGSHGDQDIGGYHLVWPRDLAHAGVAYAAAGRPAATQQMLFYLMCTQDPDGGWTQNMWVDGTPNWTAQQLDQTATFILLANLLRREHAEGRVDPWPAIRRAANYLAAKGPATAQDRWEENEGYTPYTLATSIAALVAAATFARERAAPAEAERWLEVADGWNASIERWLYVTDTPLAHEVGVEGYYVRIAPSAAADADDLRQMIVPLKNYCPIEAGRFPAWRLTSPDVLALVRYGLRRADDPRIENTVRVIDATLKCDTRSGPAWRRFNHDGYGEKPDGSPFLGCGVGRCWPVLTGERAHYELARGDRAAAESLLEAMARQAWHGLFPEQSWNGEDLPAQGLRNGEPTGSATPLVWAHAEFITLLRSLRENAVFDCPPEVKTRYAACGPNCAAVPTG